MRLQAADDSNIFIDTTNGLCVREDRFVFPKPITIVVLPSGDKLEVKGTAEEVAKKLNIITD